MYQRESSFVTATSPQRSLFIDLIGPSADVLGRLSALNQQLERALANPKVLVSVPTPVPYRLADAPTVQDRVAELAGTQVPYAMAQLEPSYVPEETVRVLQGIARYFPANLRVDENRVSVAGRAELRFDAAANVTECDAYPGLVGANVLLAAACFIEQDFGAVFARPDKLAYVCECSKFEKTPKSIQGGHNGFLGLDFLEWHRRIPHYGASLASIFSNAHKLFSQGALDMLVVDLRGRNLYSDGKHIVRRYERDYAVPLRDAAGAYVGMSVFADVLVGDINELRHPLAGGSYLRIVSPIAFHQAFGVVKHVGFAEHPIGMRNADGSPQLAG